jgi:hypothetical protein
MIGSFKAMVTTALSLSLSFGVAKSYGEMVATADSPVMGLTSASFLLTTPGSAQFTHDGRDQSTEDFSQRLIKYSGTQLDGVLNNWSDSAPVMVSDAVSPAPSQGVNSSTTPAQSAQTVVNEVGSPAAGWQILAGLAITAALVARMSRRSARTLR